MENPKRARSGKPRTQPRGGTCVESSSLQSALERIRQAASRDKKLRFTGLGTMSIRWTVLGRPISA
jgi:hypothetical protein